MFPSWNSVSSLWCRVSLGENGCGCNNRYYVPDDFATEFTEKEMTRFRELFDKYDFDDSGTFVPAH